jgi:hypothetical protein
MTILKKPFQSFKICGANKTKKTKLALKGASLV